MNKRDWGVPDPEWLKRNPDWKDRNQALDDLHVTKEEFQTWRVIEDDLARLARIPDVTKFHISLMLFAGAKQTSAFRQRGRKLRGDLKAAEDALRKAYDAVRALNGPQQELLNHSFKTVAIYDDDEELIDTDQLSVLPVLSALVEMFAKITGKSATFEARGKNRPKGTLNDWQLQQFVGALWVQVRKAGGDLTYSVKQNRPYGTMVAALERLRPLFPHLIPTVLPAKAILAVKRSLSSKTYHGFGFATLYIRPPMRPRAVPRERSSK